MTSSKKKIARPHRLIHFTPLRYPGGKGKLANYVKALIRDNSLLDGEYVEPYAGGAAIALELLFHEYVSRIHINDLSRPVYAFWKSVLDHTDQLTKLTRDTPLSIKSWDRQKQIFATPDEHSDLELGFATFFLNRTNRSGILNGGIIGGRAQTGQWGIDARFNRSELIGRIEAIAKMRKRISLTSLDALKFLEAGVKIWPAKTLIYLDPPYYAKGRDLYYDFYEHKDHEKVAKFVAGKMKGRKWLVSYDNVPTIRSLYRQFQQIVYGIGYSARSAREGSEIMFFSDDLVRSPLVGPFRLIRSVAAPEKKAFRLMRNAGTGGAKKVAGATSLSQRASSGRPHKARKKAH
ncbi:DNA adenine methylase [Ferrovibrio sp.]|uniref:DNA adenine methylase n=1 Tax=Ferrovibrio sp. TaxID=1917215 RepID=UPI00351946B0